MATSAEGEKAGHEVAASRTGARLWCVTMPFRRWRRIMPSGWPSGVVTWYRPPNSDRGIDRPQGFVREDAPTGGIQSAPTTKWHHRNQYTFKAIWEMFVTFLPPGLLVRGTFV